MPGRARITADLLAEIRRGDYGHSGKLPTEIALCDRFDVARATVREALRDLEVAEEVESRPRLGWYVRGDRRREFPLRSIDATLPGMDVWQTFCHREGLEGRAPVTVSIDVPDTHVREHLAMTEGESCVIRARLRQVRNPETGEWESWAVSTAYWPRFVAEGTALERTGSGAEVDLTDPSPLGIARERGYPPDVHRDVITARPGEDHEIETLALPARGAHVLTVCRTSHTPAGLAVRVTHDVLDTRRFRLTVEDQ